MVLNDVLQLFVIVGGTVWDYISDRMGNLQRDP